MRTEKSAKRVRVLFNGAYVVDTTRALLVWESEFYPTYYLPTADFAPGALTGEGTLASGGRSADVRAYPGLPDHVRLHWSDMDAWFEEDEEVHTHARSPYTRVDVLPSSRHVRVEVGGETVAESARPHLLFETGLPTRFYLPKTDVRMSALTRSATATHCPYKGQAEYWDVEAGGKVHKDLAWSYRSPLPESTRITGLVAFFPGAARIFVDGEPTEG